MGDSTIGENSERTVVEEVSRIVELAKELQDSAASLISRNLNEESSLRQRAISLSSDIQLLFSSIASSVSKGILNPKEAEKLEEELYRARYLLREGDAAAFLPSKSHGRFLRMFLGPINVRAGRKDIQLKVKQEYNSFRMTCLKSGVFFLALTYGTCIFSPDQIIAYALDGPLNWIICQYRNKDSFLRTITNFFAFLALYFLYAFPFAFTLYFLLIRNSSCSLQVFKTVQLDRTAFLFLVFPLLLLLLRSYVWDGCFPALPVQLYQAWLLFLYTGLALRENILRVNGSDIRPWWIYHHYCAMAMALISLTWEIERQPDCSQKQKGVKLFLYWAIMQGVAMLLQNRYQRQRLYTRIALGKARRMDVVWGETAGVEGQLWLLCPILFILQGFEAYVGLLLLKTAFAGVVSEWQVVTCGILLIIMAVGNFANTVQTLLSKSRFKAKMKKGKSKNDLNVVSDSKSL